MRCLCSSVAELACGCAFADSSEQGGLLDSKPADSPVDSTQLTKKGKKKKTVSWPEESKLREYFYFELDETERGECPVLERRFVQIKGIGMRKHTCPAQGFLLQWLSQGHVAVKTIILGTLGFPSRVSLQAVMSRVYFFVELKLWYSGTEGPLG